MRRIVVGTIAVLMLSGCSQIAAVAPVGGDHLAEVRFATGDILVSQQVEVLSGPDCSQDGDVITCTGRTTGGDEISTTSTATDMTLTVGGTVIYSGSIQNALDTAIRPAP